MTRMTPTFRHYFSVQRGDPLQPVLCGISRTKAAAESSAKALGGWVEEVSEERLIANAISPDDPDFAIP